MSLIRLLLMGKNDYYDYDDGGTIIIANVGNSAVCDMMVLMTMLVEILVIMLII